MKKFFYAILFLLLISINPVYANEISIRSNNAVLYNLNDNRVLFEKNKDQKVSIASLTKLMTALVAVENIDDLNAPVKFIKQDYEKLLKQDASGSSLKKNKTYTYEDLLYGLLLESGADCANALARLTAGNEKKFVEKMNNKAKELGMNNSRFSNPIGLDNLYNYSTVQDVSVLLKEDLRNPILNTILTSLTHKLSDGTVIHHTIYDYMKYYKINYTNIKGGKTGYELKSGYALASIATEGNTTLLLVTSKANKSPEHIKDAKKVYEYFFKNYDYQTLIKEGETLVSLNTKYLSEDKIDVKANEPIKYYLKNNYNKKDITTVYEGIDAITLRNRKNDKLGTLKIYYKNKLIINYPVVLNQNVSPDPIIYVIISAIVVLIITLIIMIKKHIRSREDFL